ncbi:hypothetical protein Tco_0987204 [Tanacetum coccineum]
MIISKSSIRSDLHLEDAEGTDCLPTTTIFEELAKMGYEKPSQKLTFYKALFSLQWKFFIHTITQCLSAKSTAWNEFSSTMASLIICLATNQKFNLSKYIFDAMLPDMSHHKRIFVNPSHTKKIFANAGKDFSGRITPLFGTMMVQASEEMGEDSEHPTNSNQIPIIDQPSTSSQPKKKQKSRRRHRMEAEVAQDESAREESVPTPSNDPLPSGEDSMQLNDLMAKFDQAIEIASLKKRVEKLERRRKFRTTRLKRLKKVGTARRIESSNDKRQDEDLMFDAGVLDGDEMCVDDTKIEKEEESTKINEVTTAGVEDDVAPIIPVSSATSVEETLAQTLMEIKAAKPKAKGIVFHDQEKQLEAELIEEERKERQKEEEANIALIKSWENTQALMEADRLLHEEVEADGAAELKKHLVIVKDDDIAIDAIPLATKPPLIVQYELLKEGIMVHYELIRADGSSKRYSSMIRLL